MINFEWLRTFKTIHDSGSISEAARKLYMTQPGASKQLSALESLIRKKLFIRTQKKVIPTEYGKFLYTQVSGSISGLEKAESYFTLNDKERYPNVVIGCSFSLNRKEILEKIPNLDMAVTIQNGTTEELSKKLENGAIDLLISMDKYSTYSHIFRKTGHDELVLIASNEICASQEILSGQCTSKELEKWLRKNNWYGFDNTLPFLNRFWEYHFKKRAQVMVKTIVPSFYEVIQVMKKMPGLCIMPLSACYLPLKNGEVKIPVQSLEMMTVPIFSVYKTTSENLHGIRVFSERMGLALV